MKTKHTAKTLKAFEDWTVDTFNAGKLKSPVHLSGSVDGVQEKELIEIFKQIKPQDWVFTTYRSHYHALLKGVPEQRLKDWILDNKSIHFMDSEHKVFSSAIVGGTLPISLGVAMAIKMKKKIDLTNYYGGKITKEDLRDIEVKENQLGHVYCFIGDTTSYTGMFMECFRYAVEFKLPITFIIENNFLSTDTPTNEVWGITKDDMINTFENFSSKYPDYFKYYTYRRKFPHYGTGKFIDSIWKDLKDNPKAKGF